MISTVRVIGTGRAGSAIAARLSERGLTVSAGREPAADADLVLLAVPDAAISDVAQRLPIGPWVAHVSGATSLHALDPHVRRFSVHPLQTLTRERGPEQLDGAWAAVTAETDEARDAARWLAGILGLHAFDLADADKPLYHAGAAMASNFLVTLHAAAARLLEESHAPPEALLRGSGHFTVEDLTLYAQNYRHGGAVLLFDRVTDPELDVKYRIAYPRLRQAIVHKGIQTIQNVGATESIHALMDAEAEDLPMDLHLDESVFALRD